MNASSNSSDKAKYEAIAIIGSESVYKLYEEGLVIISKEELSKLKNKERCTQELLKAGFTEEELDESERRIKEIIANRLNQESQILKAMKEAIELPERREK